MNPITNAIITPLDGSSTIPHQSAQSLVPSSQQNDGDEADGSNRTHDTSANAASAANGNCNSE